MFGIGWSEALVIAVLALLFVPTEDLPRLAREAGKYYAQLRRTAEELRRAFVLEADRMDAAERYKELQERRKKLEEERRARLAEAETRGSVAQAPAAVPDPDNAEAEKEADAAEKSTDPSTVLDPEEDPEAPARIKEPSK